MRLWHKFLAVPALAAVAFGLCSTELAAETMESALARAYRTNPQLNAQRAQVRSQDENVPQALSGYRPRLAVTASGGQQYGNVLEVSPITGVGNVFTRIQGPQTPYSYGLSAQQNVFNG